MSAVPAVTIRSTEPVIKKVEMLENGRDGLKVTYQTLEIRNSVASKVEVSKTQRRPVQKELRTYFKSLKEHLLRVTGYPFDERTLPLMEENITVNYAMSTEADQFMVGGKLRVYDKYTIALNGPLMKNDDYEDYDVLSEILSNIIKETKLFMNGTKGADSKTVAIDYMIAKKDNLNAEEDFSKMTKEEQDALMKEAMESYGLEVVEENGQKTLAVADAPSVEVKVDVPSKKKVEKAEEESEEEPGFELPIEL